MTSNNRAKTGVSLSIGGFLMAAAFAGSAQDAMFVDSSGNVGVGTNTPSQAFHVLRSDGTSQIVVEDTGFLDGQTMFSLINSGHPKFRLSDTSQADVRWEFRTAGTQGGDERFQVNKIGSGAVNAEFQDDGDLVIAGNLFEGSSREIKTNISPLNGATILKKLEGLEVSEWSYKADPDDRHAGPMAEEFYTTFGLGPDAKHIAPRDLAGVAMAAAKALNSEVKALKSENASLKERLEALERKISGNQ